MSRRYYSKRRSYRGRKSYRGSNILGLSRDIKDVFKFISGIVKIIILVITFICNGIIEIGIYARKYAKNSRACKGMGFELNELMRFINNDINPRQFEVLIAELFRNTGIYDEVEVTKKTCDFGRDIILRRKINGMREVTFVEVKFYNKDGSTMIGREIRQKLLGSCQVLNADKAVIVTTGVFHKNAYEVARLVNNLVLMDSYDIKKMIIDLRPEQISKVMMRTLNAS